MPRKEAYLPVDQLGEQKKSDYGSVCYPEWNLVKHPSRDEFIHAAR